MPRLQVEKFQQIVERRRLLGVVAVLHPLQSRHFIQLQLHRHCEERPQIEMIGHLDGHYVLIAGVVYLTLFFAFIALHDGSLKDAPDMLMMDNPSEIIMIVKTLDGFSATFCRLCHPLDYVTGRSAFKCILQYVNLSLSPKYGLS